MERLSDPLDDRVIKTVRAPPHKPLDPLLMYPDSCTYFPVDRCIARPSVPDLSLIRQHLLDEGTITKSELVRLIADVVQLLSKVDSLTPCRERAKHSEAAGARDYRG